MLKLSMKHTSLRFTKLQALACLTLLDEGDSEEVAEQAFYHSKFVAMPSRK